MLTKFLGVLSKSEVELENLYVDCRLRKRKFRGGFLAHDNLVSVHAEGGDICLVLGEPRLADLYSESAQTTSAAKNWLTAFSVLGSDTPRQANGRFAAIVLEPGKKRVTLITDRFGSWGVCYAECQDYISFACRADEVPQLSRSIASQSIFDYLFFHMIPAPQTIFEGVYRLPPAHILKWERGKTECAQYWKPQFHDGSTPRFPDSREHFLQLVENAVAREAANHRVGAYLSGGTDSSTVAGMLSRTAQSPVRSYTIGFDVPGYDEMAYARIAAKHFDTDHREYYVTPSDIISRSSRIASNFDQPFGNSSAVPALVCADLAKADGIEKMLAGDGGDELFAGNTRYSKQVLFSEYTVIPRKMRERLIEPFLLSEMVRGSVLRKASRYVEQARIPMPDRLQSYNIVWNIGPKTIFEKDFLASIDTDRPIAEQRDYWSLIEASSLLNQMLVFDWKYTLSDNDLPKIVGTAQSAGIEVGFPLLADELVEFSLGLPTTWKLKGFNLRWFFKEALRDFLPEKIIKKKKHGFGLPFGVWACEHPGLRSLARDGLHGLADRGVIRETFIDDLLDELLIAYPGYYGEFVWTLLMLELWLERHEPEWSFVH